ncbi:N-acetyltransferase family protein [Enterococcus sp. LJL98]
MSEALDLIIREAIPEDAAQLLKVTRKIGEETAFLVMDEKGINLPEELLALQLADLYESESNVLFVALFGDKIVGTASIKSDSEKRIAHIGELGISILKEYWGMGLGSILIEELLIWAEESQTIFRIELTVQSQNTKAIGLYKKFGFKQEAVMARGARSDEGAFLDVLLMSRMIG